MSQLAIFCLKSLAAWALYVSQDLRDVEAKVVNGPSFLAVVV